MSAGPQQLIDWFDLTGQVEVEERFNIAPSQKAGVVRLMDNGERAYDLLSWGLVPSWSKDQKLAAKMINARSETVATKPSFRSAFKKRRCLIPADGFFEWKKMPGGKQPMRFCLKDGGLFAFAGLWETWVGPDQQSHETFTILTGVPNQLVAPVHNRMPVLLAKNKYARWLDSEVLSEQERQELFTPFPDSEMDVYPVSTVVNSPANDNPECIQRVEGQVTLFSGD